VTSCYIINDITRHFSDASLISITTNTNMLLKTVLAADDVDNNLFNKFLSAKYDSHAVPARQKDNGFDPVNQVN